MLARSIFLILLAFGSQALASQGLQLCVQYDRGISGYSRRLIADQLLAYQRALKSQIRFDCRNETRVDVKFVQAPQPPHPSDALGAVRVRDGDVQPEIVIFYEPVRMLLPTRLPGVEARALAKVLAHELSHLVSNRTGHRRSGLHSALFSPGYLLSADLGE